MTLNLPIPPETQAKLQERAAAMGTDPASYVLKALEEKLAGSNGGLAPSPDARREAWERFVGGMTEWTSKLPAGRRLDDSREAIYEGRGE